MQNAECKMQNAKRNLRLSIQHLAFCISWDLVPIVIRLVRPFHRHADVVRLLLRQLRQLHAEAIDVEQHTTATPVPEHHVSRARGRFASYQVAVDCAKVPPLSILFASTTTQMVDTISFRLLDQFEATFRKGPYKHRSPSLGNLIGRELFEDLVAHDVSQLFID